MPNKENLRPRPFDSETGRESQKKSVESRRRKRTVSEITNQVLNTVVTDKNHLTLIRKAGLPVPEKPTYKDFLVASIILRTVQKGMIGDLNDLMGILGETPVASGGESQKKALAAIIDAIKVDGHAD